ncbi:uncharacterized protein LOC120325781 [Styela clava]
MATSIVSTKYGKIKGKIVHLKIEDAEPVHVFRNIPFAKPPMGKLRFMPPQKAEPWNGVRDGTVVGNCPMYSKHLDEITFECLPLPVPFVTEPEINEDCLHLSIYTTHPKNDRLKLPVMVWLYGGGFTSGSESYYDGSVLAGMNDVVVVVPNYRVGIFGFFSLGPSSICTGNSGLLDQRMALEWVQENIEQFGGDKDNVTIFGESAGAISVNHHMITSMSHGLFHKAISHSGQSTMPGLFKTIEENNEQNKRLFQHLGIERNDDNQILEAMQNIPAGDLVKVSFELEAKGVAFTPCMDNNFFHKTPKKSLEDKDFMKVPYIIGINNTEGHGLIRLLFFANKSENLTEAEIKNFPFVPLSEKELEKCKQLYIKDNQDTARFAKLAGDIIGDSMFVSKAIQTASIYTGSEQPVYMYYGTFQLRMFHEKEYGSDVQKKVSWCFCDHGDDVVMTFGMPFTPYDMPCGAKFSDEEAEISREFMKYLTNFARTGDPNNGKKVNVKWPKYTPKGQHLNIANPFSLGKDLASVEADFWNNQMLRSHISRIGSMNAPIITTKNGRVSGRRVELKVKDAKPVNIYRNIPFGRPPTGKLRFMPPQPADSWEGIKDGTHVGNMPMQISLEEELLTKYLPMPDPGTCVKVMDEDCLHLSVYSPLERSSRKLPVMVYIYGGAFTIGSEREVDGSVLAALNDVIVVVPNYRVGVFGFFSLSPDSVCAGNAGLMDQQLSLRWIQDNIDVFGGDKGNVTIFGESAGGMSVQHHILSPLSRGLFHKAISHSGQASYPGICHSAESNARANKALLEKLKIEEKDNDKILEALQEIPAKEIIKAHKEIAEAKYTFVPVVDGIVVPKSPREMLNEGNFTKVPYIIGANNTEGYGLAISMFGIANEIFSEQLAKQGMPIPVSEKGFEECKKFYASDVEDQKRFTKIVGGSLSDVMTWKAVESASFHSEKSGADVFLYLGAFRLKMHHDPEFAPGIGKKSAMCVCDHGDDIYMTFGLPFIPEQFSAEVKFTDEEKDLSRKFMAYLTNFAKTGNPNNGAKVEKKWPKYQDKKEYLEIKNPISVGMNLAEKEATFWSEVMQPHIPTMFV